MSKPTIEELIIADLKEIKDDVKQLQKQMSFVKSIAIIISAVVSFFSAEFKKKLGL